MSGVRLVHPTLRGCVLLVPDPSRPLAGRHTCPLCAVEHPCKTYHLRLDGEGAVIVSTTVWERLRHLETGLRAMNGVRRPPALIIGGARDRAPIVHERSG